jgi:glycosyltransferase involved in cell wall biosynthesis
MSKPSVSILLAVFNRQKYIAQAVRSALSQTYSPLEVIVVDDGSNDTSGSILAQFSDPRLRVITKPHTRCWDTKNRALSESHGEYVVYLDSDDFLTPNFVADAMQSVSEHPGFDWYYPVRLQIVDEAGTPTNHSWKYLEVPPVSPFQVPELFLKQLTGGIPHTGAFVRREVFDRIGTFDGTLINFGDTDYTVRHAHHLRFRAIPELNGYCKRHHAGQICTLMDTRSRVMADLLRFVLDHYSPESFFPGLPENKPALQAAIDLVMLHAQNPALAEGNYNRPFLELSADLVRRLRGEPPRVSVHIAAYNRVELFRKTLSAVLGFRGVNFEIVVVDDGSTDDIRSVVESAHDSRVRLYRFETNRGPWAAFNHAIRNTRAEWIMPIGSDDLPTSDYLLRMLAQAGPDIDYLYPSGFPLIDETGASRNQSWSFGDFSGPGSDEIPRIMVRLASGPVPHAGALIRRSLYERFGLYDEKPNVQDTVWISRYFDRIAFRRVETDGYRYRVHSGNVSRQHPSSRQESLARAIALMAMRIPAERLYPDLSRHPDAESIRMERLKSIFAGHAGRAGDSAHFWAEALA